METFKNQKYKSDVQEYDKKCEAIRVMLANRLINQCSTHLTQTKATKILPFFTTRPVSVLFSYSYFTTAVMTLTAKTCTHFNNQMHDLLYGHSTQLANRPSPLFSYNAQRVRNPAPSLLQTMPRLFLRDRFQPTSAKILKKLIPFNPSIFLSRYLTVWIINLIMSQERSN